MSTDRRERAKSIRAARDWLTGAEHALAGEDDLAGDLKLMLARAELARAATDRRVRLRRWAGRLLPLLAVAAGAFWLLRGSPPAEDVSSGSSMAQETEQRMAAPLPAEAGRTEYVETLPSEGASPQGQPARAAHETMTAAAPASPQNAEQVTEAAAPPQLPSADMQRLMQVGGKILRE